MGELCWEKFSRGRPDCQKNFKTFDYYDAKQKQLLAQKTLDTQTLAKINNPTQVYSAIKSHIDAAASFETHTLSRVGLRSDMIQRREIYLAIPAKNQCGAKTANTKSNTLC
ncbi:endonuclease toxin domain-containing protein [Moraxella lacunata]|uniref:endonuclease toxin domain-containing protein n=1 Tax=Moraxella lacunata TaxID=477 RepID=UPI000E1BB8D2|nr:hypothetical protein [Moraxella lacunata]